MRSDSQASLTEKRCSTIDFAIRQHFLQALYAFIGDLGISEIDLLQSGKLFEVHQRVIAVGRKSSHYLLESYAVALLDVLFRDFHADRITVKVRKETPVLDGVVDSVGVELSRERPL